MAEIKAPQSTIAAWENKAARVARQIELNFRNCKARNWADYEHLIPDIDPALLPRQLEFNLSTVFGFAGSYKKLFVDAQNARLANTSNTDKHTIAKVPGRKYGLYTLEPDQQGVVDEIVKDLFTTPKHYAAANDGKPGVGKTPTAGGIIAEYFRLLETPKGAELDPFYFMRPHNVIVITPKNVVHQYKKELRNMGLGRMLDTHKILIVNPQFFTSKAGQAHLRLVENPVTLKSEWSVTKIMCPGLLIVDESHKLNNPGAAISQAVLSIIEQSDITRVVCFSGTPWQKVNDTYFFARCVGRIGEYSITSLQDFNAFAKNLDETPHIANVAACKRTRATLEPYIYSFPYVKWPHKAINAIQLVDFESDQDKTTYLKAHDTYLETCRKVGRNTKFGRHQENVAMMIFRKTVEPLRAPFIARQILKNFRSGDKSTIVGCAFKQTITRTMFMLAEAGLSRDQVSIIWGGTKRLDPKYILPDAQLDPLILDPNLPIRMAEDRELRKAITTTLLFKEDAAFNNDTPEQQAYRHRRLHELRLIHAQSEESRQQEIDAYQDGKTAACLFTLAAGGTGLSLDQSRPHVLPREGYFTPVYNGAEAAQALCRAIRRKSLADVYQFILMMRGTVEQYHVLPVFQRKLACIGEITNRSTDFAGLLANEVTEHDTKVVTKLLTLREAEAVAAADDTAQTSGDTGDDDDDDE